VALGHEVAVVLPRYRETKATAVVMPSLTIPMGGPRLRFRRLPMARFERGAVFFCGGC